MLKENAHEIIINYITTSINNGKHALSLLKKVRNKFETINIAKYEERNARQYHGVYCAMTKNEDYDPELLIMIDKLRLMIEKNEILYC